jgi:outer membrane protein assembly factor BamB
MVVLTAAAAGCSASPGEEPAATPEAAPPAAGAASPGRISAGWTVADGVETPESAYVDAASGSIFVSMVAGEPGARDGNGRIMKLATDGTVVAASWVTGLNAPKGLRSHDGTLWTADIDEVVAIDIAEGRVVSKLKIDGAQFLNDVAVADDGTVYVSDMLASRIYAVKDGSPTVFAEGDDIEYPNGLLVEGNRLIVGGWGKPEPDFSTKVPGHLFALDLTTKQKTLITPMPLGNLDGVESDGRGGYVVTDWPKGHVLHVMASGESRVLREFMPGTADHAFVPVGNVAIVPHMQENRVVAYDLSDALQ